MIKEEWLPIPAYEDRYAVSNMGRVKSLRGRREGQILSGTVVKGSRKIYLTQFGGKKTGYNIRRLVASAFWGSVEGILVYNKNGDKSDDRLENLAVTDHHGVSVMNGGSNVGKDRRGNINARVYFEGQRIWVSGFENEEQADRFCRASFCDSSLISNSNLTHVNSA